MVTTYPSFAEASEQITTDEDGRPLLSVSCVFRPSGEPVYFLVPEGSDEMKHRVSREVGFAILRGREMSGYEKWLLKAAEDQVGATHADAD